MHNSCNEGHKALGYSTVQTGKIISFMKEGGAAAFHIKEGWEHFV